jgi:GT2 family glycosyltransferase
MKKVFVSIINFNGKKNTQECIASIEDSDLTDLNLTVIVSDNASKEEFNEKDINFKNIPFKFIKHEENLGFAQGHNDAIQYALANGADYILILNNDVILDKNCLRELVKSFEDDVAIVSPKIYFAKGYEFHKNRYRKSELGRVIWYAGGEMDFLNVLGKHRGVDEVDHGQFDKETETDFASGCCMMLSSKALGKVGSFDDKYFLYYEDNDLSQRIKKANFKILYQPKAYLWHKNADSTGGSGSDLQDYYITRNRLLFGFKFTSFRTKMALIRESFRIVLNGRKRQKRGVVDFYLRKFGKGSYR